MYKKKLNKSKFCIKVSILRRFIKILSKSTINQKMATEAE